VLAALILACANGANDNFKGVAALYGSGVLAYRQALFLATIATGLGALAAAYGATELLRAFSGKGLVPDAVAGEPMFLTAVSCAAAATVLLATRLGLPVSTTHALIGALVGAGMVVSAGVDVTHLTSAFVTPLLVSPALASVLGAAQYLAFRRLLAAAGLRADSCVCVDTNLEPVAGGLGVLAVSQVATVKLGSARECSQGSDGRVSGVQAAQARNGLLVLSGAAVCFARGLNDTPKIAAALLVATALAPVDGVALVGLTMLAGGILAARRVAETMSHRITGMDSGQALAANLATACLVLAASRFGLPVSTTHVSCGALFGIGAVTGQAHWRVIRQIVSAWVTTLPIAGTLGALCVLMLSS